MYTLHITFLGKSITPHCRLKIYRNGNHSLIILKYLGTELIETKVILLVLLTIIYNNIMILIHRTCNVE